MTFTRGLRLSAIILVALAVTLAVVVPAHAASLPGPSSLTLGLDDGAVLENGPAPTLAFWLDRARALGSSFVRLDVSWVGIEPSHPTGADIANPRSPGYSWSPLDANVRAAAAHGQTILLLVLGTPSWADGSKPPAGVNPAVWFPNAERLGAFAHALATRYSGHFPDPLHPGHTLPRVRYFQAWNEPNLPSFLLPQWSRAPGGPWKAVSPAIYRSMLNAFYAGVKSVQPSGVVLSAATGPYGDPPGEGQGRMAPVTFLEGLFCLNASLGPQRCPNPPHLDVLDHHPYAISPTASAREPGDVSVPDLGKIQRILDAAERLRRVFPAGPKPLWVTEIDWTSGHPDTPAIQARYLALAFYELWRQGVTHVFWYTLRDPLEPPNSYRDAGLYYYDGSAKPAVAAYRFPFVAVHSSQGVTLWGRAPRPGEVLIQRLVHGRWRHVLTLQTTSGGIFYAVRRLGSHLDVRAVSRGTASPIWMTG